ncbi:PilZ domain-containing protein [Lamprobacter modestohalophilus]|uniref:PilZ domain-containing protein n=1 Tax=Lamprobacter modestohalophilus TaxID=1064514 RepID=UPI002ADECC65|nr:PilZ domain-containing protein [Lamprobacter modestohalophilus]MEA1052252.1 PilZ domain-containing protein [Lamprobacter modestohalophilus]
MTHRPLQPPSDATGGSLPIPGRDQRQRQRVIYRDPVQVSLIGGPYDPRPHALLAEDLSESGLALTSAELFAVGTRLLMDLEPEQAAAPIRLIGRVIWVAQEGLQQRYRLGVTFEDLGAEARIELQRLVAKRGRLR